MTVKVEKLEGATAVCDFCGDRSDAPGNVTRFIQGPDAAICEHCVLTCVRVLYKASDEKESAHIAGAFHEYLIGLQGQESAA